MPYNPMASTQRTTVTYCFQLRFEQSLFSIEGIIVDIVLSRFLNFDIHLYNLQMKGRKQQYDIMR